MTVTITTGESEILTRKEASEYLRRRWRQRVCPRTLEKYAQAGTGPAYFTTDTRSGAFYYRTDLDEWARGRLLPGKVARKAA